MKLFDLFKRARSTDPVTSFEAAEINPEKHFAMIVDCLSTHGPMGKDGIASRLGLESSAVSRRLPELQKMGVIKLTGNIVKSSKNRNEREWTV